MSLVMYRFVLAGALIAAVGCHVGEIRGGGGGGGVDGGGGGGADAGPGRVDAGPVGELRFSGIYSVEATGDTLIGAWTAAAGASGVEYTLFVTTLDSSPVAEVVTSGTSAVASGLPDGEYRLRVEATDSVGRRDDGGVVLTQLIGDNRVVKRSEVALSGAADVWGEGDIIVVAGYDSGVSALVVDVSDVHSPQILAQIVNEGFVKDIKIGDGLLMLNGEGGSYGARIFDFTNPSNPVRLSRISSPSSVHNIGYSSGYLYLTDNNSGSVKIVDLADPANPNVVATWWPPSSSVHDQSIVDGKMYTAWWNGFAVTDVSDPTNPVDLVVHYYSGSAAATHNAWPSKDGSFVLTSDETSGGQLRIFDVRNPGNVQQIADWSPSRDYIIHNVLVRGDYAFIAYYTAGMRVLDISDPFNPIEVGWWDEESGTGMSGTWGVWPFGNHVAISSMHSGLIMVDFFPKVVTADRR